MRAQLRVFAGLVLGFLPGILAAQTPALGPEFQVNTYTTNHQAYPGIAVDDSGKFLIAWDSVGQDGNQRGVYGRLFSREGSPLTGEVPLNTYTTGNQHSAAVAAVASAGFVVVWQDNGQDGSGSGIFGRRLDAAGAPVGGEFPINAFTTSVQEAPRVGADGSGNFVVVWQSFSQDANGFTIVARRFDADANPLGGDLIVNQYTSGNQVRPDVSMGPSGEFVVVWESQGQDGDVEGIFARRYDATGSPVSSEIAVNTYTTGAQTAPSVALAAGGEFVVVWQSLQDGSQTGIRGRAFDDANVPLVDELAVNTHTTGNQEAPRVAADAEGRVLVIWESVGQEPGSADRGVFLRVFDEDLPDPEFQVNVFTNANQTTPAICVTADGQFVAAWQSLTQDGGGSFGVFARLGGYPDAQPLSVDGRPSSGVSNVNGVLEVGETVAVDPAWANLAGASLTLSGTAADFGGPAAPVYSLLDASADYGTIPSSGVADCFSGTMNCYEVRIDGGPRPASHWDATFDEALDTGVTKRWTLHVGESFADVPVSGIFYAFIENIFHNGITAGGSCGGYCPTDPTRRKQMAVFVLKAQEGPLYVPPPAVGVFNDVPASDPFAPWIEELFHRGVVAGCATPGGPNYCPEDPVLRQQMAVFLLKTLEGSGYAPPGCLGIFLDVPCPGLFTDFVEELAARGIAAGCGGNNYCPVAATTRGQMAPFLVKTFGLELYGP